MCGRYTLNSSKALETKFNFKHKANFNIAPGLNVILIDQNQKLITRLWGIKPKWNKGNPIINARFESYKTKATFKSLSRCVFLTDGYYEWKKIGKNSIPFYHYIDDEFFFFAGLYNDNECCILTKESQIENYNVHNRQPVCLSFDLKDEWLKNAHIKCFKKKINFHPVSLFVNSSKNNNINLIKAIDNITHI